MITLTKAWGVPNANILGFSGKSTDVKPIGKYEGMSITNGSEYKEIDTGNTYSYDAEGSSWYLNNTTTSGGGSGANGITPHIGENGNWFIGSTDTGVSAEGENGGYYIPAVTQPSSDKLQISFAPSKSDMPAVNPVTVNLPVSENSGQNVAQVEPAYGDIPLVFFGAPLQQSKDEIVCEFWYHSKTMSFHCWAEIKAQGNSTMLKPKKNQTVKLYEDASCTEKLKIDFRGWGKQNKFVIKAYWQDLTHTRDVVSVRLEGDCTRSRPDFDELPELLRTSPNLGGVDGFPVLVYANGVYQGRYMWNIPKDKWMTNMDDDLDTHCILCSENYVSGCFREPALIDGTDWTDEIHDTVPESIKNRWNEVISFVRNSTDEDFVANLDSYIDVASLIDRHLMGLYSCDYDGYGKNQLYITYNGVKWYADRYDKDGTWGGYYTGNEMLPADYDRSQYEDMNAGYGGNLLFIRMEALFHEQLRQRWQILRDGPLSVAHIISRFRELYDVTPPHIIAEDYAPTTANGAFVGIPGKTINNIQQIQSFVVERRAWMDDYIARLTPVIPVPCTGITLDHTELMIADDGSYMLTATVTPADCTDPIIWDSSDGQVATVNRGVITAVSDGSCTITAHCGEYSAECAVEVSKFGSLPDGYTAIPYAIANGKTYFDTGITATEHTSAEYMLRLDRSAEYAHILSGIQYVFPYPRTQLVDNQGILTKRAGLDTTTTFVVEKDADAVFQAFADGNTFTVDGKQSGKCIVGSTADTTTLKFASTGDYSTGPSYKPYCFAGRIYYLKIFERGVMIRNYSPCVDDGGVVGFYESVEGVFCTSINADNAFTAPVAE